MTTRTISARSLARLSLLLAALLQLGGAATGPWLHRLALATAAAQAAGPAEPETPAAPAPHDEQSCVVCHALGTTMLSVEPSAGPPARISPAGPFPEPLILGGSPAHAAPQARAPPLA